MQSYINLNILNVIDTGDPERKRKRRSRWMGSEDEKAVFPGMPTILPPGIAPEKAEAYIGNLKFLLKTLRKIYFLFSTLQF